jgi:hypothetical protein
MAKVPEYLMPENFFPPRLARGDDERDVNKAWFEQFTRYVMAAHGVDKGACSASDFGALCSLFVEVADLPTFPVFVASNQRGIQWTVRTKAMTAPNFTGR